MTVRDPRPGTSASRPGAGLLLRLGAAGAVWAVAIAGSASAPTASAEPVRAAYFYHYMGASHLDSLAARGFDRAVIHWIRDSLFTRERGELRAYRERGARLGMEVVFQWAAQSAGRLAARPEGRRYTWGDGRIERDVACPLDSVWWRSAIIDRVDEHRAADGGLARLAVDLELYAGSRHHYDAGPCRCPHCIAEYTAAHPALAGRDPRRLSGLHAWEEARLAAVLEPMLRELAARHPGLELAFFDLDYDSFVHRAWARALARAGVPTADYCERSYGTGGASLAGARARLEALGLAEPVIVGGLWLKRWTPAELPGAVRSVNEAAAGYFVFTTFSLWLEESRLEGPYTLKGSRADYWDALAEANRTP